jgi:aspartyl-tRNA(Asn)/glutamyl-tRNA(Gln) amidotransferase subunit A
MNVMKRPDARDWTSLPPNDDDYTAALGKGFAGLRVAWSPRLGYAQVHPEVAAGVKAAVRAIESAGARVEEVDPGFDDPLEITTGLWFVGSWMVWNALTPEQQAVTDPDFRAQAELGSRISALHVQQLQARRVDLGSRMRQFMQHYDLLVTPSIAVPAFEIRAPGSVPMTPEAMLSWTPFSYPFNLTQQPACTVPCALTADGLPIGIQFVGPMFRDDLVLRAGAAYEAIRPIPRPPVLQEGGRR